MMGILLSTEPTAQFSRLVGFAARGSRARARGLLLRGSWFLGGLATPALSQSQTLEAAESEIFSGEP